MKALTIAWTGVVRLIRDRSNLFFVFILPIGIIILIGAQFGSAGTPKIGIVLEEGAGQLGDDLAKSLQDRGDIETFYYDTADGAARGVERGAVQAAVVIPSGYDDMVRAGQPAAVGFYARPDAAAYQAVVLAEVSKQSTPIRAAQFSVDQVGASFDEALASAIALEPSIAGVTVVDETIGESAFGSNLGQFDLGASSQLVLFMFLTGLTGATAIIETRRLGVARRMLSTPTTAGTVVAGEGLGRFAVVMVQGLYILFSTLFAFGVAWGDPIGAAAVMIMFGAVCAGTAMLMGTLFKNDQQAGGVGVILGLGVAALGGCMVPIEFFSDSMQRIAHVTPHAWALDAFAILVREGGGLTDIIPQLAVLAGFAVVLITIAGFRLRHSMTTT